MPVSKVAAFMFLCFACSSPEEAKVSTPEPVAAAPVPAKAPEPPKETSPKCKELMAGWDKLCEKRRTEDVCSGPALEIEKLRNSDSDEVCSELITTLIPMIKAGVGETPWGLIEGEVKLPQTFSTEKIPKNFISDGDGFEKITEELKRPFLAATSSVLFAIPRVKTPEGLRVGFRLYFFEYQSDLDLLQKTMTRDDFRWAIAKDNLLIVLPRVMASAGMEAIVKRLEGKSNVPPSPLPIDLDLKDLATEYRKNEIKAEATYKGKRLIGSGTVDRVRRDMLGDAYVYFSSARNLFDASCLFPKDREKDLALLEEGSIAFIEGTVGEKTMLEVRLTDCLLLAYVPPEKK